MPSVNGAVVRGVVACIHVFGLGIYLPEERCFGHVDVIHMGIERTSGLDDYPQVGGMYALVVLGHNRLGQLRLRITP
jgi:hypothetical protein